MMFDWIVALLIAAGLWVSAHLLQPQYVLAAISGAFVRAIIARSGTVWERLFGGFGGVLCAVWLTPVVCMLLGIAAVPVMNAVSFVLGMTGMYLAEALVNVARKYAKNPQGLKEFIRDLILRLITKK
jgi:hypothetical protein